MNTRLTAPSASRIAREGHSLMDLLRGDAPVTIDVQATEVPVASEIEQVAQQVDRLCRTPYPRELTEDEQLECDEIWWLLADYEEGVRERGRLVTIEQLRSALRYLQGLHQLQLPGKES